jgi:hypothetical protein
LFRALILWYLLASHAGTSLDLNQNRTGFPIKRCNRSYSVTKLSGEQAVQTDFTVLRANLAAACRKRNMAHDPLNTAAVDLHFAGVRALDIYRLARIADELDVSVDWLLGRTDTMELPKAKAQRLV